MRAGFVRSQLPGICWMAAIFVASCIPGKTLPPLGFKMHDKVAHLIEFGLLGWLLWRAFSGASHAALRRGAALWTGAVGVGWGVLDEVHQLFVPGREASVYDALADALGVLGGMGLALWMRRRRVRSEERAGEQAC